MIKTKKPWCKHIEWRRHYPFEQDGICGPVWSMKWMLGDIVVPRAWKVCPICEAERPTKANIKAAELRFAMDNDQ